MSFSKMKRRVQSIAVCLLFFGLGCSDSSSDKATTGSWAILVTDPAPGSSWRLEGSVVPEILDGAKVFLEQQLPKTRQDLEHSNITAILSKWDSYSCQLFPLIQKRDGRKVIALRFFPTRERVGTFKDWRSVPLMVKGGGYDYWTVSYDPEKREYFAFGANALR